MIECKYCEKELKAGDTAYTLYRDEGNTWFSHFCSKECIDKHLKADYTVRVLDQDDVDGYSND